MIFFPQFWYPLGMLALEHLKKEEILVLICYSILYIMK